MHLVDVNREVRGIANRTKSMKKDTLREILDSHGCEYGDSNILISLFHRAFQFTMCNGPTNALVCNKTLIQMSHIKTLKITPACFDHQLIIIRKFFILVKITV
jgi:hypothetical protein